MTVWLQRGAMTGLLHATTDQSHAGMRLDRALALLLPTLSRERLKRAISAGQVSLDGRLVRDPATKVKAGQAYQLDLPPPEPMENVAQAIALDIVFEDEHLLVVNKPAGLVVHPACGNPDGTLVNALLHHCAGQLSGIGGVARPGIVHRIDKDTSGLLVVAKTDPAHQGLAAQFKAHSIERVYTAVTAGLLKQGEITIEGWLGRSEQDRKKMAVLPEGRGKHAVTHVERLHGFGLLASLVEARLETGRTHQVRVHLASIGHGLLGDPLYGRLAARSPLKALLADLTFSRQALHAGVLGFIHPVTRAVHRFEAELPGDMVQLIRALGEIGP